MPWLGTKKLAFIPVFRPRAIPPDQIPVDWPNQILRRALFDPNPASGGDRSLRTYIQAASSGRADLDAVVMPMQTLDQQDVPPDALEGQFGSRLRQQGFDAAAIVMLGGVGAGTNLGFWSRFVMAEDVGVWAMEFIHSLTGFQDLYPFGGNMGAFDEMACNCGTHPSAYTKAAIRWLEASAITLHSSRTARYDLHSVGLVQPPPSGRSAAVRIGSKVPYLMVEARQKVDQFDINIPSEGVIVYRVQTPNPLGLAQNETAPVMLLTPTALKPGDSFTSDTKVTVRVTSAIPGGFTVTVEDLSLRLVDRTAQFGTPPAAGAPTACVISGLGVHNIAYRDTSGRLHELWRDAQGGIGTTNLTANARAPLATGNPFAYVDTSTSSEILLYRGRDNNVHSLYWSTGPVGHDNLTGPVGAPKTAGNPVGWFTPADAMHHVVYRTANGHLHELWWVGPGAVGHGDLTAAAAARPAAGDPSAYFDPVRGNHVVVYRGTDGRIRSLYWSAGPVGKDDLSGTARTAVATSDPVAYYTPHNDTHQVVYTDRNGRIYELYWQGAAPVVGWDLTTASGAPAAVGNLAAYYSAGTSSKRVIYRSANGRLHEIWWVPGGGTPVHSDLTTFAGAPRALDRPAAFTVEGPNTQHVAYRGTGNHIYEVIW